MNDMYGSINTHDVIKHPLNWIESDIQRILSTSML